MGYSHLNYLRVATEDEYVYDEKLEDGTKETELVSTIAATGKGDKSKKRKGKKGKKEEKSEDAIASAEDGGDEKELSLDDGDGDDEEEGALLPPGSKSPPKNRSFLNLNEWGEPEGTKQEVIQKVLWCSAGLNIVFVCWGLLQERILTKPYDGVYFEYSYGLVFLNRLGGLILSGAIVHYYKVDFVKSPLWEYSFPSVANMLSSWCQYEALKYVSFPTQMLAKAFKMVPVMLMGTVMMDKTYESYEYASAAVVGFGLYLFIDSSEHIDFKENVFGQPETITGAWCGVVLLGLFLAFDSFTSQWQARWFHLHKSMSPIQMMLIMNAFSSVFAFITLIHQEELGPSLAFVYDHPNIALHVLLFIIFSTIGQILIFYTVKSFGAVVFSIIMSIRILLSTLISCFVYDHHITEMGMLGIIIVFGAIAYRIRRKTDGKPIIRWKESLKVHVATKKVFSEWHENMDDC